MNATHLRRFLVLIILGGGLGVVVVHKVRDLTEGKETTETGTGIPLKQQPDDDCITRLVLAGDVPSTFEAEPRNAQAYFELATHLYFTCHLIRAAIKTVERGLELSPESHEYRFFAIDLRINAPTRSRVQEHFEVILRNDPTHRRAWSRYLGWARQIQNENLAAEIEQRRSQVLP